MKYDHRVKKNGMYYEAGEDVPDGVDAENVFQVNSDLQSGEKQDRAQAQRRGRPKKTE